MISQAKEVRKSPSKLRQKFSTNFAENFANFTLEIAGACYSYALSLRKTRPPTGVFESVSKNRGVPGRVWGSALAPWGPSIK